MQGIYSEKDILGDALSAEKMATEHYNTFANECAHEEIRNAILDCLEKEHDIQVDVFNKMHERGYYPTPEAQSDKIMQVKQTYSQMAGIN